jgi:hypothetical protein
MSRRVRTTADSGTRDASRMPSRNDPVPDLTFERVPLDRLKPARRRVRKSSKAQTARVRRSIEAFGCVRPLLIAGEGEVIDGHAVLEALHGLRATAAPCIRVDHLSEIEIRELRISLNRTQERGEWDDGALRFEFENLLELGCDLSVTGFEPPEVDLVIGNAEPQDDSLDTDESFGTVDGPAVSAVGDQWGLGGHRIICASARSADAGARLIGEETVAMVFTDPPFNVPVSGHIRTGHTHGFDEFSEASGEMTPGEFEDFLSEALGAALARLVSDGLLYVFIDWRHTRDLDRALDRLGLAQVNLCVWVKPVGGVVSRWWWKFSGCVLRAVCFAPDQAARSRGMGSIGLSRVCHPSTLRMVI